MKELKSFGGENSGVPQQYRPTDAVIEGLKSWVEKSDDLRLRMFRWNKVRAKYEDDEELKLQAFYQHSVLWLIKRIDVIELGNFKETHIPLDFSQVIKDFTEDTGVAKEEANDFIAFFRKVIGVWASKASHLFKAFNYYEREGGFYPVDCCSSSLAYGEDLYADLRRQNVAKGLTIYFTEVSKALREFTNDWIFIVEAEFLARFCDNRFVIFDPTYTGVFLSECHVNVLMPKKFDDFVETYNKENKEGNILRGVIEHGVTDKSAKILKEICEENDTKMKCGKGVGTSW